MINLKTSICPIIGVCGVYGEGERFSGGQPVKVKTLIDMMVEKFGYQNVLTANTCNWKQHPMKMLKDVISLSRNCDVIFMLPAHNGVRVFAPLFYGLKKIFHFQLVYSVIGGWLPIYTKTSRLLSSVLRKIDYIFVETSSMRNDLIEQGFTNVYIVNNAKKLKISTNCKTERGYLKLCYFSRVMCEKGIEDLVNAVLQINNRREKQACTLDIYGPIDPDYRERFMAVSKSFSNSICYKGVANPSDSVETLEKYDCQVFPTRFATEGIPGSIIDSYAAGVPVIAARWNSYSDVVEDGITGIGYTLGDIDELTECIEYAIDHKFKLTNMREACISRYNEMYSIESVFERIEEIIKWQ